MSDHLPECLLPDFDKGVWVCCCAQLRACEQRSYTLGIEVGKHDGWVAGHAAGVQAARDAVAARRDQGYPGINDALAAIDALKEEDK